MLQELASGLSETYKIDEELLLWLHKTARDEILFNDDFHKALSMGTFR